VSEFFELLGPALVMTILLVAIHTLFGLHVLRRNIVFIDLALAQMAALGATVAFSVGHAPLSASSYTYAFAFALGGAVLLSGLRFLPKQLPHEALIGILYIVATATTMLFIEKSPQGAEHLKQLLTGNIVTVQYEDTLRLLPLYAGIAVIVVVTALRGGFQRAGLVGWCLDLLFYALFAAVVTSSVAIAGVLLVFSFLIVPACIGLLLAATMPRQWLLGVVCGSAAGACGLGAAYAWDLSAGAALVCAFGAMLVLVGALKFGVASLRQCKALRLLHGMAVAIGLVLVASGVWTGVAPRADQPLLDAAVRIFPALQRWTISEAEQRVISEARVYAERYRVEAARLNKMEADDRVQGTLTDEKLAKIASFIKAFNEMRTGEEFAAVETLARSRTRNRWWLCAGQVGLGMLLLAAVFLRRRRTRPSHRLEDMGKQTAHRQ
jgi:zinc/manganese transport system permease protein